MLNRVLPVFVIRGAVTGAVLWALWRASRRAAERGFSPGSDLHLLSAIVLATSAAVLSGMVLGTFGLLRDWAWALALLGVTLGLSRVPLARAVPATESLDSSPPVSAAFWIVAIGFAVGRFLFSLRNPPADYDSLHYHTPMVAAWIASGTLGVPQRYPPAFGAYFPGTAELIQAFFALVLRRETLMTLPSVAALPLIALGVRRLGLQAGARRAAAEVGALALVASSNIVRLTLGTRIDLLVALWWVLVIVFAVEAIRRDSAFALATSLLAAGLLMGAKSNAPLLLLIAGAVVAIGQSRRLLAPALHLRAAVPIALFMSAYWYVRNWYATGNPYFPAALSFGPLRLPGLDDGVDLPRTTQLSVWFSGFGGHLTAPRAFANFGVVVPILALAGMAACLPAFARGRERESDARLTAVRLSWLTLVSFGLFLVTPFSGAYRQPMHGLPPLLNLDNLRLLLPTLGVGVAAGVSLIPAGRRGLFVLALVGLGALVLLRPFAGHLLPGVVAAGLLILAARRMPPAWKYAPLASPALWIVVFGGVAALAAVSEPLREKLCDRIWDGYLSRIHNLKAADVRAVRLASHGVPFAVTGMHTWANFYGRDFSGRPVYVPIDREWRESRSPWRFAPDDRHAPQRDLWLGGLRESGARFLVVGIDSTGAEETGATDAASVPEWGWALADTARFHPFAGAALDRAYRISWSRDP